MDDAERESRGIFVTPGTRIVIPANSLVIAEGPDGPDISIKEFHLSRQMAPTWTRIAFDHLQTAEAAHMRVIQGHLEGDDDAVGHALNDESVAGMQAILAAATAFDALYASAKGCVALPASLTKSWQKNGTARWRQVAEVLRRAFQVNRGEPAAQLREALRTIYRFRGMVVHPSSAAASVVLHPDLDKGTDWRFVSFSAASALGAVWAAISFTKALVEQDLRNPSEDMIALRDDVATGIASLCDEWEARYGDVNRNPQAVDQTSSRGPAVRSGRTA